MSFQSTVFLQQGFGVIGELFNNGPVRCQPFRLVSALATYNVMGRGFSITAANQGLAEAGNTSGTLVFAGILANPKTSPLQGTLTGTLTPTLQLPNQAQAELLRMGSMIVTLPAACNIGDLVVMDNITGILTTIAPGAALPVGKSSAYAVVSHFLPNAVGAQLAVITMTDVPKIPT